MKQLQIKTGSLALGIVLLFAFTACQPPPEPGPIADCTLYLEAGYLGDCDSDYAGEEELELTVSVEQINPDFTTETTFLDRFFLKNSSAQDKPNNLEFEIEVPESGMFIIVVEADISCSSCCNFYDDLDEDPIVGHCSTSDSGEGFPNFRAQSGQYNADAPPSVVDLTPVFKKCFGCGCED